MCGAFPLSHIIHLHLHLLHHRRLSVVGERERIHNHVTYKIIKHLRYIITRCKQAHVCHRAQLQSRIFLCQMHGCRTEMLHAHSEIHTCISFRKVRQTFQMQPDILIVYMQRTMNFLVGKASVEMNIAIRISFIFNLLHLRICRTREHLVPLPVHMCTKRNHTQILLPEQSPEMETPCGHTPAERHPPQSSVSMHIAVHSHRPQGGVESTAQPHILYPPVHFTMVVYMPQSRHRLRQVYGF